MPGDGTQYLRAGPFGLLLQDGDLRAIAVGEREVLRRIAVVARGPRWDTIPTTRSNLKVDADAESFRVEYDGLCRGGQLEFAYHATIVGDPTGTISFGFEGHALTTFMTNRIGLVLLHPVEGCAGQPYRALKVDGSTEQGIFPDLISPHQPMRDLAAVAHQAFPDVWVEVRFTGDTFEMEDQRNWTDASFKTYSGPLERSYPYEVAAGARIAQTISISLDGAVPAFPPAAEAIEVQVGSVTGDGARRLGAVADGRGDGSDQVAVSRPFPRVGLALPGGGAPLTPAQAAALKGLRLAHLRVDVHLDAPGWEATLRQAAADAAALDTRLELAVFVDADDADDELRALSEVLSTLSASISHCLLLRADGRTTDPALLRQAAAYLTGVPLGGGTNGNFTELNRDRPSLEGLEYVCYSLNPQVHADDTRSIVENLAGQAETVRSARAIAGSKAVVVSPVTFSPAPGNRRASHNPLRRRLDGRQPEVPGRERRGRHHLLRDPRPARRPTICRHSPARHSPARHSPARHSPARHSPARHSRRRGTVCRRDSRG